MSEATDVLQAIDQLRRDLSGYHGQLKAHDDLRRHCDNQRERIAELEGLYVKSKAESAKLREQMEQLVTLLRNDCDIEASWDGLRRFWSIELTEDGCLMRDRACKAEAENVKLREFASEAFSMAFNFYHGAGTAEDLRELEAEYHELGIEVPE